MQPQSYPLNICAKLVFGRNLKNLQHLPSENLKNHHKFFIKTRPQILQNIPTSQSTETCKTTQQQQKPSMNEHSFLQSKLTK